jgi:hypothetical protein
VLHLIKTLAREPATPGLYGEIEKVVWFLENSEELVRELSVIRANRSLILS